MTGANPVTESQKDSITQALSQVAAEGDAFLNGNSDPESRERLVNSARQLVAAAETPVESLLWNIWALPTRTVALRVAVDLKIFETAVSDDGRPKTDAELAAPTGASPMLTKRITRVIVSMGMLGEAGPGIYVPNSLTRLLAQPDYAAGVTFIFDTAQLAFAQLPTYLQKTEYRNPEDTEYGAWNYANNFKGHGFEWLTQHPTVFEAFHRYIHTLRTHRPSWFDMYPVQARLVEGLRVSDGGTGSGDASALVDVGGSMGQILQDFAARVPQYKGRLVLQELAEVVAAAAAQGVDRDGRIELQVHDFFTPQPVRGARAYFLRTVLHDWSDAQCQKILGHLKDAMEPGYSRILISECVLADEGAAWQHVSMDMFMMAQTSSRERTSREWAELVEGCGLKIAGIYNKGKGNEGLIEVVLE